jgi:hypothetical protein
MTRVNRRDFLEGVGMGAALVSVRGATAARTNVVLIMAD